MPVRCHNPALAVNAFWQWDVKWRLFSQKHAPSPCDVIISLLYASASVSLISAKLSSLSTVCHRTSLSTELAIYPRVFCCVRAGYLDGIPAAECASSVDKTSGRTSAAAQFAAAAAERTHASARQVDGWRHRRHVIAMVVAMTSRPGWSTRSRSALVLLLTAVVLDRGTTVVRSIKTLDQDDDGAPPKRPMTKRHVARTRGDILIGALFPVHKQPSMETAYTRQCSEVCLPRPFWAGKLFWPSFVCLFVCLTSTVIIVLFWNHGKGPYCFGHRGLISSWLIVFSARRYVSAVYHVVVSVTGRYFTKIAKLRITLNKAMQ